MLRLEETHPQIRTEFLKGNFVVHKSSREFSALAIDQAHEQANAVIKGEGGAIGVTEDPSALRRWFGCWSRGEPSCQDVRKNLRWER